MFKTFWKISAGAQTPCVLPCWFRHWPLVVLEWIVSVLTVQFTLWHKNSVSYRFGVDTTVVSIQLETHSGVAVCRVIDLKELLIVRLLNRQQTMLTLAMFDDVRCFWQVKSKLGNFNSNQTKMQNPQNARDAGQHSVYRVFPFFYQMPLRSPGVRKSGKQCPLWSAWLTFWRPLLQYGYSYKASCARTG